MALTDKFILAVKPLAQAKKYFDAGGLYLYVPPSGSKVFRYAYRFQGKPKTYVIGKYPDVSLKEARRAMDEAKQRLADGIDPNEYKKAVKHGFRSVVQPVTKAAKPQSDSQATTASLSEASAPNLPRDSFKTLATEWFHTERLKKKWSDKYAGLHWRRIEEHLFPYIGGMSVKSITPPLLYTQIHRLDSAGFHETARRVLKAAGKVFRFAIGLGLAENDPSSALVDVVSSSKVTHYPTITNPKYVGELLRAIDGYNGHFAVKAALQISPLVFVRPTELRAAEWTEFHLKDAEWWIPAERMKQEEPHIVPLARQAMAIIEQLQSYSGGSSFLFPNMRHKDRPFSENTVNAALSALGYGKGSKHHIVAHGFRAMASTLLNESEQWSHDVIERQLAHSEGNEVRAAYNYAQYLPTRKKMMQYWADYLDELKAKVY